MMRSRTSRWALLLLLILTMRSAAAGRAARDYLATIRPSSELQEFLDRTVDALAAADPRLPQTDVRIALLDMSRGDPPLLAQRHGETPIYPASVVKFVYLMAAYAWQEEGKGRIDPEMDVLLREMVHDSSNQATRAVFARLTDTAPGPALAPDAYRVFRERRLAVERWLHTLGITDLHCVNPTYDGNGDLFGRDRQFLADRSIVGGLPARGDTLGNRNTMTAVGTAKLLALLATDRALSPSNSAAVRLRMRRDPAEQPHLVHRIAGGAARLPDLEVYSKSGTWGAFYADAGIIRRVSGCQPGKVGDSPPDQRGLSPVCPQLVLVVFTAAQPPYRGDFIADLAYRCAEHLLVPPEERKGQSP